MPQCEANSCLMPRLTEMPCYSYLDIYAAFSLFVVLIYGSGYVVWVYGNIRASRKIHDDLSASILGSTLRCGDDLSH